ncbi:hypothetical protein [Marinobacter alexandrii]|uniref:hypothetical protein n=1 Tax=Marinobacter alexandrii TaxID=2570351 RepID=UPI00110856FA|nr:hypothetical protein [Marinobacter alexandrii]
MKYFRYFLIAILAGAGFSLGILFVFSYALPHFESEYLDPHNATNDMFEERINEVESSIGMSCKQLHREAYEFAIDDIGNIIDAGLQGRDWIKEISPDQKRYIDEVTEQLYQCMLLERPAEQYLQLQWPEFSELQRTYSALKTFSTSYGDGEATAEKLKPQALERMQFHYQNLTRP